MAQPIEVYYWPTPNGNKVTIALEEMGLPYEIKVVNIGTGEQFKPEFLQISPNNRMPAIVDPDGPGGQPISVFESGAILQYLGRKSGQFYGTDERSRVEVEEWLFWQVGGVGPMAGQANHFLNYAPTMDPPHVLPYAQLFGPNALGTAELIRIALTSKLKQFAYVTSHDLFEPLRMMSSYFCCGNSNYAGSRATNVSKVS